MTRGGSVDDFARNKIAFLTFNYDRSLEFFLLEALQNKYGIGLTQAQQLLDEIPIVHLHGQLGKLAAKVDPQTGTRPYMVNLAPASIALAAEGISIVHEDIGSYPQFGRARDLLRTAEQIWILGFGYLRENVERLDQISFWDGGGRGLQLFGTFYGLADAEIRAAKDLVTRGQSPGIAHGAPDWDVLRLLRERWL